MFETTPDHESPDFASDQTFTNPFRLADLQIFDAETMRDLLAHELSDLTIIDLALALHHAPPAVVQMIKRALPPEDRARLHDKLRQAAPEWDILARERRLLDALFWELTYWKTPGWYDDLTEGEQLHPGIFRRLRPELRDSVVLDAGAGSGRATLDALRQGARFVYAIDPSPGLLRILNQKVEAQHLRDRVWPLRGKFNALPLRDNQVDMTLSCAAFTVEDEAAAEQSLAEMRRVTRAGGCIALIWPRPQDLHWLAQHGFAHVAVPVQREMKIYYRSLATALRIADRFYGRNQEVKRYLMHHRQPMLPFSLLGTHPPHDYCWLRVEK